jgi:hypothetical protein
MQTACQVIVRRKALRKEVNSRVSTSSRIVTRICESHALKGQLFPLAERADSPKNKFFGAVIHLNLGLVELSYSRYQHLQATCLLWNLPLILDQRWRKMFVRPLGCITQVNVKPPSGGAFAAAPEGGLQIFLLVIAAQCQPNVGEHFVLIVHHGIEVPEQAGDRWNAKLAVTQHGKTAKCHNGVQVQMD